MVGTGLLSSAAFAEGTDIHGRAAVGHNRLAIDRAKGGPKLRACGTVSVRADAEQAELELMARAGERPGTRLADLILSELPEDHYLLILIEEFEQHAAVDMDRQGETVAARKKEHIDIEGVDEAVVVGVDRVLVSREHHGVHTEAFWNIDGPRLLARRRLWAV